MNILDINESILDIINQLEAMEQSEEIDIDFKKLLEESLNNLSMERDKKIDSIASYIKILDSEKELLEKESSKLKKRAKEKEDKINWLKEYVKTVMELTGKKKMETAKNVLSIRKTPAKVVVTKDAFEEIYKDREFVKENISYSVDKKALKLALENGEIIEGAKIVTGTSINIK